MRAGIIACRQFWGIGCPGLESHVLCFDAASRRKGPLGNLPEVEIVSYEPCQGCSVSGLVKAAEVALLRDEAEVIVFPSCLFLGHQCPSVFKALELIQKQHTVTVILGSYFEGPTIPDSLQPTDGTSFQEDHRSKLQARRQLNFLNLLYLKQALMEP